MTEASTMGAGLSRIPYRPLPTPVLELDADTPFTSGLDVGNGGSSSETRPEKY